MIYSRSSEYAIRACIHLAHVPPGKCAMAKDIAKDEQIPAHFLAKILQNLARKGILRSTKGPSGGFCLNLASHKKIALIDIVSSVDGLETYERCVMGLPRCWDGAQCPMHPGWVRVRSRIVDYLSANFLDDLARVSLPPVRRKRNSRAPAAKRSPNRV